MPESIRGIGGRLRAHPRRSGFAVVAVAGLACNPTSARADIPALPPLDAYFEAFTALHRHEIAALVLTLGVLVFGVVTATNVPPAIVAKLSAAIADAVRAPGPISSADGEELGTHDGAVGYTPGQRRGLGLSSGPWYVREVRPAENRLVVDRASALEAQRVSLRDAHWFDGAAPSGEIRAVVRHRHASVSARVEPGADGSVELAFEKPVWAPAPGQAAVVYDAADERVLGGGWITGARA